MSHLLPSGISLEQMWAEGGNCWASKATDSCATRGWGLTVGTSSTQPGLSGCEKPKHQCGDWVFFISLSNADGYLALLMDNALLFEMIVPVPWWAGGAIDKHPHYVPVSGILSSLIADVKLTNWSRSVIQLEVKVLAHKVCPMRTPSHWAI